MIRVDYRGVLFFRLNWLDSHLYPVAAFITVSMVGQNTPGFQASQSYLLIQQLLIFSGITKQDVCQFSPHIFVLEVANLREARKQEKDGKVFFTSTAKKNSIKYIPNQRNRECLLYGRSHHVLFDHPLQFFVLEKLVPRALQRGGEKTKEHK